MWHIRKMLLLLLLDSVQSLTVLPFCAQLMCFTALLIRISRRRNVIERQTQSCESTEIHVRPLPTIRDGGE